MADENESAVQPRTKISFSDDTRTSDGGLCGAVSLASTLSSAPNTNKTAKAPTDSKGPSTDSEAPSTLSGDGHSAADILAKMALKGPASDASAAAALVRGMSKGKGADSQDSKAAGEAGGPPRQLKRGMSKSSFAPEEPSNKLKRSMSKSSFSADAFSGTCGRSWRGSSCKNMVAARSLGFATKKAQSDKNVSTAGQTVANRAAAALAGAGIVRQESREEQDEKTDTDHHAISSESYLVEGLPK